MNAEIIVTMLKNLKLTGMAEAFSDLMNMPLQIRPSLDVCVSKMIEAEKCERNNALTEKLLRNAKLHHTVYVEDIECSLERNLTQSTVSELADCSFIRRGENLIVTGQTGVGKSFIICALGRQACMAGLKTLYVNLNRFMEVIAQSRLDGTFQKLLDKLNKNDLLILDDFGLQTLNQDTRLALLQLLEDRYECKSVIIASQLPIANWYDYIGDNTLADSIMDRLVNTSIHIQLTGPSMRRRRK